MGLLIHCLHVTYTTAIGRGLRLSTRHVRVGEDYRCGRVNDGRLLRSFHYVVLLQAELTMRAAGATSHAEVGHFIFRCGLFRFVTHFRDAFRGFVAGRVQVTTFPQAKQGCRGFFDRGFALLILSFEVVRSFRSTGVNGLWRDRYVWVAREYALVASCRAFL